MYLNIIIQKLKHCFCHLFQMTGLDIEKDQIIEMACIITDSDLNVLAEVNKKPGPDRTGPLSFVVSVNQTQLFSCFRDRT